MADVGSFLEEEHMAIFEGAGVAIVTPFKENGEISFDKLDELIEEQKASLVRGLKFLHQMRDDFENGKL